MKGMAISNYDTLKSSHNSFSKNDLFVFDRKKHVQKDEDAFHFVSYVPVNGRLLEFDGLQHGPIDHGEFSGDWLELASKVLSNRIEGFGSEIRFNLMAVIESRSEFYEKQLQLTTDEYLQSELREKIIYEEMKLQDYAKENSRRKHNFLPLIMELLKAYEENSSK